MYLQSLGGCSLSSLPIPLLPSQLPSKSSLRGQSLRSLPHPNLLRDLVRAMFR